MGRDAEGEDYTPLLGRFSASVGTDSSPVKVNTAKGAPA